MGHQWMKPVIKVNKVKENNCKEQLQQLCRDIDSKQIQINQLKQKLFSYHREMSSKVITPHMMVSSAMYSKKILQAISGLGKQLSDLKQEQNTTKTNMTEFAQKRILLEGLQEKQHQQELAQIVHKEETMVEETCRYLRGN